MFVPQVPSSYWQKPNLACKTGIYCICFTWTQYVAFHFQANQQEVWCMVPIETGDLKENLFQLPASL